MQKLYFIIFTATLACQAQAAQELCVDPRAPKEYICDENLTLYMPQEDGTFMKLTRKTVNDPFSLSKEEKDSRYALRAIKVAEGEQPNRRHRFELIKQKGPKVRPEEPKVAAEETKVEPEEIHV